MSKFARMLDVLDLFSESVTLLSAEEIADLLKVSRPTAFRYARELSNAGFLANHTGRYSLGARIVSLDYRIRQSDPILRVARPAMQALSAVTGYGTILCRMYNDEVINEHHEAGHWQAAVTFGRGRTLPLFRGAASKVMLATLPTARLRRLYERHAEQADVRQIAGDWTGFRQYFAAIRSAGSYVSREEIDRRVIGIAAPILVPDVGVVGALALVMPAEREAHVNMASAILSLVEQTTSMAAALNSLRPVSPSAGSSSR